MQPDKNSKKVIAITAFHPMIGRNVLRSGLIDELLKNPDIEICVLVPEKKLAYFAGQFSGKHISVAGFPQSSSSHSFLGLLFKRMAIWLHDTKSSRNLRRYQFHASSRLDVFMGASFFARLSHLPGIKKLYRLLDQKFCPKGFFRETLVSRSVSLVLLTDIQNENDVSVGHDARDLGIPLIGMVRSWDNLTLRMLRILPDKLIVSSNEIASEAIFLHGVAPSRICIVGNPHYDRYLNGPTNTKESFFRRFGLDILKPLVLYAPVSDAIIRFNDIDALVLRHLSLLDCNILVRFPPEKGVTLGDFTPPPHIKYHQTGVSFDSRVYGDREISQDDDDTLRDSLYYSDVVVTGPTSLLLDAAFFSKPAIAVDFYPSVRSVWDKVWRYEDLHIQKILKTGSVIRIFDPDLFISEILRAIDHPEVFSPGVSLVKDMWFSHSDGRSVLRVSRAIMDLLYEKR